MLKRAEDERVVRGRLQGKIPLVNRCLHLFMREASLHARQGLSSDRLHVHIHLPPMWNYLLRVGWWRKKTIGKLMRTCMLGLKNIYCARVNRIDTQGTDQPLPHETLHIAKGSITKGTGRYWLLRKGQLNRHTRYRPATTTRNTATQRSRVARWTNTPARISRIQPLTTATRILDLPSSTSISFEFRSIRCLKYIQPSVCS